VLDRLLCRCVGKKKNATILLDLVDEIFFLVILSGLIVTCITRFGRFVRNLKDQ